MVECYSGWHGLVSERVPPGAAPIILAPGDASKMCVGLINRLGRQVAQVVSTVRCGVTIAAA